MARRLRQATAGGYVPAHDSLVRMIHYWETGHRGLTERYELLYAAALDIEPDRLQNGPGGMAAALTQCQELKGCNG
jgi:hypothetical protein